MRVLAIGAHADDVELGCGGSLLKHRDQGDPIHIHIVTNSEYTTVSGRCRSASEARREAIRTAAIIGATISFGDASALDLCLHSGLVFELEQVCAEFRPTRVYTHFSKDLHSVHEVVARATLIAARHAHEILGYRVNLYHAPTDFDGQFFVDVSDTLEGKLALIEMFESEAEKVIRWQEMFRALAQVDGLRCGVRYAECFSVARFIELSCKSN